MIGGETILLHPQVFLGKTKQCLRRGEEAIAEDDAEPREPHQTHKKVPVGGKARGERGLHRGDREQPKKNIDLRGREDQRPSKPVILGLSKRPGKKKHKKEH